MHCDVFLMGFPITCGVPESLLHHLIIFAGANVIGFGGITMLLLLLFLVSSFQASEVLADVLTVNVITQCSYWIRTWVMCPYVLIKFITPF